MSDLNVDDIIFIHGRLDTNFVEVHFHIFKLQHEGKQMEVPSFMTVVPVDFHLRMPKIVCDWRVYHILSEYTCMTRGNIIYLAVRYNELQCIMLSQVKLIRNVIILLSKLKLALQLR